MTKPGDVFRSRMEEFYARTDELESRFGLAWVLGYSGLLVLWFFLWFLTPPAARLTRFAVVSGVSAVVAIIAALRFKRFELAWAIVYPGLFWLWYSAPPGDRIQWFAIIFAALGVVALLVAIWSGWGVRKAIHRLRALEPAARDEILGRDVPAEARAFYEKRLAAEGAVESDGTVERFPFSPVDRRETIALFWGVVALAAITLATALGVADVAQSWRSAALAIGVACVTAMPMLLRRLERLQTVLELTPFAIVEVSGDGQQRWLHWGQSLYLRNRPWLRRLDLTPQEGEGFIPIHYSRIGLERLISLVVERGGFGGGATPAPTAPDDAESS